MNKKLDQFSRYSDNLYRYYERLSADAFAERQARLAALGNEKEARCYADEVRFKLSKLLEIPTGRPAANATVVATFEKNGVLIDKLFFQTAPQRLCTALFLRQPDKYDLPGILVPCGHAKDGKASEPYQRAAFGLALKGFGVLIFDPIGQGEMRQYPAPKFAGLTPTSEHNMLGMLRTIDGRKLCSDFIGDAMCAIDCLLARPEVRPNKIGVTGNSGGGQMAYFLHGLDDRVEISAPSCHMNTLQRIFRDAIATDAESSPAGLLAAGCDRPDFAIAGAPKPLLLIAQKLDFINLSGVKSAFADIKRVYTLLGHSENANLFVGTNGHGFYADGRAAMFGFFTRYYFGKADSTEPEITPLSTLEATIAPDGLALNLAGNKSIPQLAVEEFRARKLSQAPEKTADFLRNELKITTLAPAPCDYFSRAEMIGNDDWTLSTFGLDDPVSPGTLSTLCLVDHGRSHPRIPEGERCTLLIAKQSAEEMLTSTSDSERRFALEVRGIGQTRFASAEEDYHALFGREYFLANTARLLGDNLTAGRVRDILIALATLREAGYREITLEGHGCAGVLTAYVTALGRIPGVAAVRLLDVPHSLVENFADDDYSLPEALLIPGMLRHFDLPQLYSAVAAHYCAEVRFNGI